MDELDGRAVLERVEPPGRKLEQARRNPVARHGGEGVVRRSRPEASHQRPPGEYDEEKGDQPRALTRCLRVVAPRRGRPQFEDQPDRVGVECHGEQEMGGEPVVADRGTIDQARCHHRPAQGALQAAQHQQGQQPRLQVGRELAPHPEPGERQREDDADQPAPQAVAVLQPEDLPEFHDVETTIDQSSLRRGKILLQFGAPRRVGERRQPAGHRPPFDHRQARFGQSRERADHDHEEDHCGNDDQPVAHGGRSGFHGRPTMREAGGAVIWHKCR